MKFTNAEICSSAKSILQNTILPNLNTAESQAACAAVQLVFDELIKREESSETALKHFLGQGLEIVNDMVAMAEKEEFYVRLDALQRGEAGSMPQQVHDIEAVKAMIEKIGAALYKQQLTHHKQELLVLSARAAAWELDYERRQANMSVAGSASSTPDRPLDQTKLSRDLKAAGALTEGQIIQDFKRVPGGMSKQTYFFDIASPEGAIEPYVVRKSKDTQLLDLGCLNIKKEYYLLKDVYQSGFPCPEPLWFCEPAADVDGAYFVMRRMPGKIIGSFFGSKQTLSETLLMNLAALFARLHRIDVARLPNINHYGDPRYRNASVEQALALNLEEFYRFWENLDRLPSPFEIHTLNWLRENIPANPNPAVLTHNDLLVHNFLADGNEITAVLDWEGALIGDPAADLGYVKNEVTKHMEWDKFLAHYRESGGWEIDERAYDYHAALTNLRNLAGTNKHTKTMKSGVADPKDIMLTFQYVPVFMNHISNCIGLGKNDQQGA